MLEKFVMMEILYQVMDVQAVVKLKLDMNAQL
jgi:hypothetical protein